MKSESNPRQVSVWRLIRLDLFQENATQCEQIAEVMNNDDESLLEKQTLFSFEDVERQ